MRIRSPRSYPALALHWLLRWSQNRQSGPGGTAAEQGLSLIECLVAIVIITLTVVAMTPPLMLANATRIQARRATQANQIAQGEIDRIRSLVERRSNTLALLPAPITSNNIANAPAPTTIATGVILSPSDCTGRSLSGYPRTTALAITSMVPVDVDGDCVPEYAMQVFRTNEAPPTGTSETVPFAFVTGVRVYAYNPAVATSGYNTQRASLVQGTGPRDLGAGGTRRPLAVLFSPVARNDSSLSLSEICKQAAALTTGGRCPSPAASPTPSPSP